MHSIIPITPGEDNEKDFHNFFNSVRSDIFNELNYPMAGKQSWEWYTTVRVVVYCITQDGEINTAIPFFRSRTTFEMPNGNVPMHISEAFAKINNSFAKITQQDSGWTLHRILNLKCLEQSVFSV